MSIGSAKVLAGDFTEKLRNMRNITNGENGMRDVVLGFLDGGFRSPTLG
jgi:hypothetical protein